MYGIVQVKCFLAIFWCQVINFGAQLQSFSSHSILGILTMPYSYSHLAEELGVQRSTF